MINDPDAFGRRGMKPDSHVAPFSHRSGSVDSRFRRARSLTLLVTTIGMVCGLMSAGCRSSDTDGGARRARRQRSGPVIRRVACVYDQKPWLNLDLAGDRDPEGIRFRVFLDPGTGRGVLVDGTLHVEMYRIERRGIGEDSKRTLISDWHYSTSEVPRIGRPGMLGDGYVLPLRWATKDVAGSEIELITRFEDRFGNSIQGATKRFRVPKYTS